MSLYLSSSSFRLISVSHFVFSVFDLSCSLFLVFSLFLLRYFYFFTSVGFCGQTLCRFLLVFPVFAFGFLLTTPQVIFYFVTGPCLLVSVLLLYIVLSHPVCLFSSTPGSFHLFFTVSLLHLLQPPSILFSST